jgi:hypothetical protein
MNKLIAFGDSFTWGSELGDELTGTLATSEGFDIYKKFHHTSNPITMFCDDDFNHRARSLAAGYSKKTWPALYATEKKMDYRCFANPGCSNSTISRKFFKFLPNISSDDFVIVNWTWIDRWDVYDENGSDDELVSINNAKTMIDVIKCGNNPYKDYWRTLRVSESNATEISKLYFKYLQSELWNKFETLKLIALVSNTLKNKNIPFIMTSIDDTVYDKEWNCPDYINTIQEETEYDISWFDGMGFYDWSKYNNFPLGKKNNHPLEEAHQAAFEYAMENYEFA